MLSFRPDFPAGSSCAQLFRRACFPVFGISGTGSFGFDALLRWP